MLAVDESEQREKLGSAVEGAAHAFFGVAFFFGAPRFFGAIVFATGCGAFDFVTRPDLVLPRTTGALSSTAGACDDVSVTLV